MPKKITQDDFIKSVKLIHGENIDFSNAVYIKDNVGVECKCNICGNVWWAKPNKLKIGHGCPVCGHKKIWKSRKDKTTTSELINRMKEVFPNYDFSKNDEIKTQTQKIKVICKKHGEFDTTPDSILHKHGCRKCQYENMKEKFSFKKDDIIKMANNVHNHKYRYDKSVYINIDTAMIITCLKHGDFLQTPYKHIRCKQGCPMCVQSHLEEEISSLLKKNGIKYVYENHFNWLGLQSLDFYLPEYNLAIECQGEQHYKPIEQFGGNEGFLNSQERDKRKKKLCEENGVKLLYYTHYKNVNEDNVTFKDCNKLLNEIEKYELRK